MMICRTTPAAIAVVVSLLASACASANRTPAGAGPSAGGMSAEQYEALYEARLDSARSRFTPADVRFMSRMLHHHAQAIEMSNLVPERTDDSQIRTLAARIINAQNDEMAIMRRWLEDRGQPVPQVSVETADHAAMGHGAQHAMDMPGMLSPAELLRLRELRGREFDRLFLASMIRHHQGAVTMVKELFATDGAAQDEAVFKFASDVQVDQATEVARMESMLAELDDDAPAN